MPRNCRVVIELDENIAYGRIRIQVAQSSLGANGGISAAGSLAGMHESVLDSAALQIGDAILSSLALGFMGAIHSSAIAAGGATPRTYDTIWWLAACIALVAAVVAARMRPIQARGRIGALTTS